ncbi:MAG TPA: aldose 1-epimerase [Solirubrobacterales bacterium]|nr:aldose 1-epimerase [Solirubrobacterales bacterium]
MVGERIEEGLAALTLESEALGGLEAIFIPEAGMICCSLRHRGEELLGQRGGLAKYVEAGSTMGIPFLHPWANRLGESRFELAGREVSLDLDGLHVKRDDGGLPMHGLLTAARGWQVERHLELEGEEGGGVLAASFDFGAYPRLLEAFPFPHRVEIEATLAGAELRIATTVQAGGQGSVPIAFGFHPYLRLPGAPRAEWEMTAPVHERLELDEWMLPTGRRESIEIESGPLGTRTFDDAFLAPAGDSPFVLAGGGRRLELRMDKSYPFAQIYAPEDLDAVAFEPMVAPTNALVSGEDLRMLPAGESFTATFSITVREAA